LKRRDRSSPDKWEIGRWCAIIILEVDKVESDKTSLETRPSIPIQVFRPAEKEHTRFSITGELLKKAREEAGLSLEWVEEELKIGGRFLKVLEDGTFEELPSDVYTIGYIRQYAQLLGISPEPVLAEYMAHRNVHRSEIKKETTSLKKSVASSRMILIIPAVISAVVLIYFFSPENRIPKGTLKIAEIYTLPPEKEEARNPRDNPPESQLPDHPDSRAGGHHLILTATDTSWLRIEKDGEKNEEIILRAGESREWMSPIGFRLRIGNAGGVRIRFNGTDMGVPGERGKVLTMRLPEERRLLDSGEAQK
jgi:cytoskeleton protein RodZ